MHTLPIHFARILHLPASEDRIYIRSASPRSRGEGKQPTETFAFPSVQSQTPATQKRRLRFPSRTLKGIKRQNKKHE